MVRDSSGYTMKSLGENIRLAWKKWKKIIFAQSLIHWLLLYAVSSTFEERWDTDYLDIDIHFWINLATIVIAPLLIGFNFLLIITGLFIKMSCLVLLTRTTRIVKDVSQIWAFRFPVLVTNFLLANTLACGLALATSNGTGSYYPYDFDELVFYYVVVFIFLIICFIFLETIAWLIFYSATMIFKYARLTQK